MVKRQKKIIGVVIFALIAAGGGYGAYKYWKRAQLPSTEIVLYGNIDIREADLGFNTNGRIDKMLVDEGDVVKTGQHLASLETGTYDAEINAAKAQVNARKAALDLLLAGSRPETIKAAQADVQVIAADLENARVTLRRIKTLTTDNFATIQQRDDAQARVNSLKAKLRAAKQQALIAVQGPRIEDIAQARAVLKEAEAGLELARQRLNYTRLTAKNDGVVKTRNMEPGDVIMASTPIYTIALSELIWVRTYVSEINLGKIYSGMTAEVMTDSAPNRIYKGQIGFISPVAEFTPKTVETPNVRTSLVYRLRVNIKQPDKGLLQGMPVTVRLKLKTNPLATGKATSQ